MHLISEYCNTTTLLLDCRSTNLNTTEIYAAQNFTFGPVTGFAKFSYALSTTFGFANSRGSYYPDLTLNYDTGVWGLSLNGYVGYNALLATLQLLRLVTPRSIHTLIGSLA